MKIKISVLMTVAALLLLTGCPKKEDNNPEPRILQLSLFTNPTDGALFQVQYEDGTTITCFGTKDAEGLPVAVQTATATFPEAEGLYQVKLENGVKPVQVLAGNGCVFEYDWLSTSSFRLKAISPTGEVQVSIPVDLGTMGEAPEQLAVDPVNIRQGIASVAGIRDIQESPSSLKEVTGNMTFNIIQCGQKVNNAFVTIQTTPQLGQPNQAVTFSGDGAYSANLPQSGAPPPDYEKECEKLGTVVHDVCDYYSYVELFGLEGNMSTICTLLSNKIQEVFPGSGEGQKIINTCANASKAISAICKFNKKTPIVDLCNLAHLLYDEPKPVAYTYSLSVTIPGRGTFTTQAVEFNPSQPSSWDVDLGGTFAVQNLHTIPADPSPKEGYTAYADVLCPDPAGTKVTISVVGTDGYSNSKEYDLTANAEISLTVPGGAEGVMDIITVSAMGQQLQISIVF